MKKALYFTLICALTMLTGCSKTTVKDANAEQVEADSLVNDNATIYGLACDDATIPSLCSSPLTMMAATPTRSTCSMPFYVSDIPKVQQIIPNLNH